MEKKEKKTESRKPRPPIFQLTGRFLAFASLFVLVCILFYTTGIANHFLDSSLLLILGILQAAGVVSLLFCLFLLVEIVVFAALYRDLTFLWHLIPLVLALGVSLAGFGFSGIVSFLAAGTA